MNRLQVKRELFPPSSPLLSLPIVRWTVFALVAAAFVMTASIVYSTNSLRWSFTGEGYQVAADLFKAPIAILLLSIPLIALFASNHRSVQTMKQMSLTTSQIDLANGQNLFANYFKHVEEFSKWCDHIKGTGAVRSKRKLHKVMFPDAQQGNFGASSDFIHSFNAYVFGLLDTSEGFSDNQIGLAAATYMHEHTRNFSKRFWLTEPPRTEYHEMVDTARGGIYFPPDGLPGFIQEQVDFVRAVDELLSFDSAYESADMVRQFLALNTRAVPRDHPFVTFNLKALVLQN